MSDFENLENSIKNHIENVDYLKSIIKKIQNSESLIEEEKQFLFNLKQIDSSFSKILSNHLKMPNDVSALESEIKHQESQRDIQRKELEKIRKDTKSVQIETDELNQMSQRILSLQSRLENITNERALIEVEIKSQISTLSDQREKQQEIIKQLLSYYQN